MPRTSFDMHRAMTISMKVKYRCDEMSLLVLSGKVLQTHRRLSETDLSNGCDIFSPAKA